VFRPAGSCPLNGTAYCAGLPHGVWPDQCSTDCATFVR
jgi:hypothetical protein